MATSDLPPKTLKVGDYTFTISEANYDDIPAFVDAFSAAFSDNLLFKTMSGTGDPALLRQKDLAYWEGQWRMSGRRHFKVVDEATGKIAAISRWWFPHVLTPEEVAKAEEFKNGPQPEPIPGTNSGVQKAFVTQLASYREKWVKTDDMYMMNILAVVPTYQRLGLGAALLIPVLKIADKEGRKTFIESSQAGEQLYRRLGWVETGDRLTLDLTEYGAEGSVDMPLMMREPGAGLEL